MDKTFRTTQVDFKTAPSLELDDLTQECWAYMKTKQFMAKRIFEQQDEVETLKNQLFYHSIKHVQMYDWLKYVNEQLQMIKYKKEKDNPKEDLNLSEDLASSFVYEQHDKVDVEFEKKKNISSIPSNTNLKEPSEIENLNKIINTLTNENLELKKENELIRVENLDKNLTISKLKAEKFVLYNELNELINSLKTIDLKVLNKFYKNYSSNLKLSKGNMPCSMGIKYNVLSVQNQLTYLMHSDLIASKVFSEYVTKTKEAFSKEKLKQEESVFNNVNNNEINVATSENFIDLDKYMIILKKFENEFEKICDKNLKKNEFIHE